MKKFEFIFGVNALFDYDALFFSTYNILKYIQKSAPLSANYPDLLEHPVAVKCIKRYLPYIKPRSYSITVRTLIS